MTKTKHRPKGTRAGVPNHERPAVAVFPAACPTCGSTANKVEGRATEQQIDGEINGRRFNRVVWRPVVCLNEACRQHYTSREHRLVPK